MKISNRNQRTYNKYQENLRIAEESLKIAKKINRRRKRHNKVAVMKVYGKSGNFIKVADIASEIFLDFLFEKR